MLSSITSQKFRFWSFVSMFFLVFVHGYNLHERYLEPWTIPGEPLSLTTFTEYWIANGILRFRIPMLFIISGFLYALNDQLPNRERIPKRLRTLLVPYLLWSAIGLFLTFVIELFPYARNLIATSHIAQIDNSRMLIHDYHWYEILARWIFFPVSYQLWFIRVLLVYNLTYPALRWCVTHRTVRWIFFGLICLLWIGNLNFVFFDGEGLLFFSLGIWIQKNNFDIEIPSRWFRPAVWGIAFMVLTLAKTWLAFDGVAVIGNPVYPLITIMHKLSVAAGLIACWYGCDRIVVWAMDKRWFVWLSAFSFFIYALHAPFVAYAIDGMFEWLGFMPGYRILTFVLLPLMIIAVCILVAALLRAVLPKTYAALTGGRGLAV